MLRGAILGLGNVAVHGHLPGWLRRRDVEIMAATDLRPAQRAECAARLPRARWHDTPETLLETERPDFVDICTPPSSHCALIRRALERGCHVLCEKPLVGSVEDLVTVGRLAAERGLVLHTVHNWHYAPIVRRARELVEQRAIGELTSVVWHTLRTRPAATGDASVGNWRLDPGIAGGGVLTDHGWHVCYLIHRWIGALPTALRARLETRRHTGWSVEDTATLRVTFPRATAEVLLTWAADARRNWAELRGAEGVIELQDDTLVLVRGGEERRWPCPPALSDGSHHADWFDPVVDEFVSTIAGSARAGANLEEAALCVTLETLARESSRRGGQELSVSLPSLGPLAGSGASI